MHVGEIIQNTRKQRKMTLVELSKNSGVALASLSRIENGKMTGTLASHMNIALALGVSLTDLYKKLSGPRQLVEAQIQGAESDVVLHDRRVTTEVLASKISNKKMMPVMIKLGASGATQKEETGPGIERFIFVSEGKIEASIGEEKYNLTKGDTLYFISSLPHYFKNTGKGEARLVVVTSPPAL